jgi:hypothetical protein
MDLKFPTWEILKNENYLSFCFELIEFINYY